jgi:hypothetical protein
MGDIRRLGGRNGVVLGRDNAEPEVDARETSEGSKNPDDRKGQKGRQKPARLEDGRKR